MIKIVKYDEVNKNELFLRDVPMDNVSEAVSEIINEVKTRGDDALFEYTELFDRTKLSNLEVTSAEINEATSSIDSYLLDALTEAAENIRRFHTMQLNNGFKLERDGIILGQKVTPVDRAGLYVPGGTASYPSTVLMDAIPAKIAGVPYLCMVTPPDKNGRISPAILTAAKIAGIDHIFKVGGAQAIAALAYGTKSIPKVDVIVGPGNAYVAEAKKQVFGQVGIDMIAGPSEILIVADKGNDPVFLASDLLAQAEHDRMATAILVTDDEALAFAVQAEIEKQLEDLPRAYIAAESIENRGKIIVVSDIETAIDIANEQAPEHLELSVEDPLSYLDKIRHAGSIFCGKYSPEALGDYFAGPNHTLPTGGSAKFSSPLSVDAFTKKTQYIYYVKENLAKVAKKIDVFARAEGLDGHARSILNRFSDEDELL